MTACDEALQRLRAAVRALELRAEHEPEEVEALALAATKAALGPRRDIALRRSVEAAVLDAAEVFREGALPEVARLEDAAGIVRERLREAGVPDDEAEQALPRLLEAAVRSTSKKRLSWWPDVVAVARELGASAPSVDTAKTERAALNATRPAIWRDVLGVVKRRDEQRAELSLLLQLVDDREQREALERALARLDVGGAPPTTQ